MGSGSLSGSGWVDSLVLVIHQKLLETLKGHQQAIEQTGEAPQALFDFLKLWLLAHICGIDKKYGDFTAASKVKAAS